MCGDLIIIKIACFRHFLEFSKIFIFSHLRVHFWIFFKRLLCARALKEFTSRNAFPLIVIFCPLVKSPNFCSLAWLFFSAKMTVCTCSRTNMVAGQYMLLRFMTCAELFIEFFLSKAWAEKFLSPNGDQKQVVLWYFLKSNSNRFCS